MKGLEPVQTNRRSVFGLRAVFSAHDALDAVHLGDFLPCVQVMLVLRVTTQTEFKHDLVQGLLTGQYGREQITDCP